MRAQNVASRAFSSSEQDDIMSSASVEMMLVRSDESITHKSSRYPMVRKVLHSFKCDRCCHIILVVRRFQQSSVIVEDP